MGQRRRPFERGELTAIAESSSEGNTLGRLPHDARLQLALGHE